MSRPYDNDPRSDPFDRYFRPQREVEPGTDEWLAEIGAEPRPRRASDRSPPPQPPPSRRAAGGRGGGRGGGPSRRAAGRGDSGRQVRRFPSKRVRRKKQLLVTSALMSLIVLVSSGGLWAFSDYAMSKIGRIDPFAGLHNRPQRSVAGAMNILVAGADRREGIPKETLNRLNLGHDSGNRSDTMLLAHISEHQDSVVLVSLPRDSLVTIPRHKAPDGSWVPAQRNKLNAAYSFGGPQLAVATVEQATGVRIDHYVEMNFLGFVKVVDALGGVNVCTPAPVNDPRSGLRLSAGRHLLDGVSSLAYVRTRYSLGDGSDLSRIERQQAFLGSMMQRATSTGTLLNPVKLSRFLDAALSSVRADQDFTAEKMRALALDMRNLSPSKVNFITVPISDPGYTAPGVGSSVMWDRQQAGVLFERLKNDTPIVGRVKEKKGKPPLTIPPNRIAVQVYNAAGTPGLAGRTAEDLERAGFLVPEPGQNWSGAMGAEQTVIEYGPNRADSARTVQAAIPGSVLRENPEQGDDVAVVVGSGYSGTKPVQVAAPSSTQKLQPKTAAQNPCRQ
ncbi:MAG: LytR family transcriptional regulator [Streptosporangiales bacterium]|nr:LytR family transcriptional regulator [Streptosporangiales bacterium]